MSQDALRTEMMDWNGCKWVESVPDRMHGVPVVVRTRMDADGVLLNFDEGMSARNIAQEFGVPLAAVNGILAFAGRMKQSTAA